MVIGPAAQSSFRFMKFEEDDDDEGSNAGSASSKYVIFFLKQNIYKYLQYTPAADAGLRCCRFLASRTPWRLPRCVLRGTPI